MSTTNRYYDTLNTAARLPARVLRNFSLAVAIAGTGATLAALLPAPLAGNAIGPTPAIDGIVTLPTVTVRATGEAEPVTLATVTVRASDALRDHAVRDEAASMLIGTHARGLRAVGAFAHGNPAGSGFAMPYYSFAKPLRVSNEE